MEAVMVQCLGALEYSLVSDHNKGVDTGGLWGLNPPPPLPHFGLVYVAL